jgi:hypothetical protein
MVEWFCNDSAMLLQHNVSNSWPARKMVEFLGHTCGSKERSCVPTVISLLMVHRKKATKCYLVDIDASQGPMADCVGQTKLDKKDFSTTVTLLHGDMETSSVAMKDNIGCGGQTVWHIMHHRKQNVTYKAVDGSPKARPPPGTYDCELWLDNAQNKEVHSFAVLENHP